MSIYGFEGTPLDLEREKRKVKAEGHRNWVDMAVFARHGKFFVTNLKKVD